MLAHGRAVLRCLPAQEPALGVTQITGRLGVHQSTVSRLLAAPRFRVSRDQAEDLARACRDGADGITRRLGSTTG